jgi:hypothetical protein
MRNSYKILVVKREGKIPRVRPRRRWEDNIRMNFREVGGKVWIGCIWLRIGPSDGRGNEPSGTVRDEECLD